MIRRSFLRAAAVIPLELAARANSSNSQLSVEAYIFQQYAQRRHKPLAEVLPEVIPMASKAGFHNIELNGEFFAPELKKQTLELIRANGLRMPSVYSGGALHEKQLADRTIEQALAIAALCQPFGCNAVVCNANPKGPGIEKTDSELSVQAEQLNRMGRALRAHGCQLRVHNHTPEMLSGAREWRYTLQHTDPKYVSICLDLDWVHQGDQDPLGLLKEAGKRVDEIHVRNSRGKLWLEDLSAGDVKYESIAAYLKTAGLQPLIVVELAYHDQTAVSRPLVEDLTRSRLYAEKVFGIKA